MWFCFYILFLLFLMFIFIEVCKTWQGWHFLAPKMFCCDLTMVETSQSDMQELIRSLNGLFQVEHKNFTINHLKAKNSTCVGGLLKVMSSLWNKDAGMDVTGDLLWEGWYMHDNIIHPNVILCSDTFIIVTLSGNIIMLILTSLHFAVDTAGYPY